MNRTVKDGKKIFAGVWTALLFVMLAVCMPEKRILAAGAGEGISSPAMMEALSKVNVRREPDTSAEVLGQLLAGERVFAVELTEEGWYRVAYNGETGYVRKDFLEMYTAEEGWDETIGEDTIPQVRPGEQKENAGEPSGGSEAEGKAAGESSGGGEAEGEAVEGSSGGGGIQVEAAGEFSGAGEAEGEAVEGSSGGKDNGAEGEKEGGKSGVSNVLILVLTGAVIAAYAVFQVLKERRDGSNTES